MRSWSGGLWSCGPAALRCVARIEPTSPCRPRHALVRKTNTVPRPWKVSIHPRTDACQPFCFDRPPAISCVLSGDSASLRDSPRKSVLINSAYRRILIVALKSRFTKSIRAVPLVERTSTRIARTLVLSALFVLCLLFVLFYRRSVRPALLHLDVLKCSIQRNLCTSYF